MWIACLVLALQAPAAAPEAAFDARAAQVLLERHSTAFGPGTSRTRLEVRRVAPIGGPVAAGQGYFLELAWVVGAADGERPEVGVATVVRLEELPADSRILGLADRWALADLAVDKTWDDFTRDLALARASASDASALGAVRGVMIGQTAFKEQAQADGAVAGTLDCLAKPAGCLEGYAGGPFFEAPEGGIPGYVLALRGPAIAGRRAGLASTFVVTAIPSPPSDMMSAYCGDSSGRVCYLKDGAAVEAACPADCSPVE